jgi:hypothetical protein
MAAKSNDYFTTTLFVVKNNQLFQIEVNESGHISKSVPSGLEDQQLANVDAQIFYSLQEYQQSLKNLVETKDECIINILYLGGGDSKHSAEELLRQLNKMNIGNKKIALDIINNLAFKDPTSEMFKRLTKIFTDHLSPKYQFICHFLCIDFNELKDLLTLKENNYDYILFDDGTTYWAKWTPEHLTIIKKLLKPHGYFNFIWTGIHGSQVFTDFAKAIEYHYKVMEELKSNDILTKNEVFSYYFPDHSDEDILDGLIFEENQAYNKKTKAFFEKQFHLAEYKIDSGKAYFSLTK